MMTVAGVAEMAFDRNAALAVAEASAASFAEGLKLIVATVEESLEAERRRLADESRSVAEAKSNLELGCARLEAERSEVLACQEELAAEAALVLAGREDLKHERARLDMDRRLWGGDTVHFNVSGAAQISALRSTVALCEESMLAASLSGRWPVPRDDEGRVFINFSPQLFLPLVEHMQLRSVEDPEEPAAPPEFESDEVQARFEQMLRYLGMLEWVYRPELIEESVVVGKHCYATLPPQAPEETTVGRDMQDLALEVPRGWEVLSTSNHDFDQVIGELTLHCWGTQVLCVLNDRGSFDGYRTSLRTVGGPPGSVFQADIDWLQAVEGPRQRFRFRGLSGRLVVRARCDQVGEVALQKDPCGADLE